MSKSPKKKRSPKRVLALPDLAQAKSAVDHAIADFVDWYCSEPRLAFNRTVVLRYRIRELAPHDLRRRCAPVPFAGGELDQIQFLLGTFRFRERNDISDASKGCTAPSTTPFR